MSGSGVEESSGMTTVRLNGIHVKFEFWGLLLTDVAEVMTNTRTFTTKGELGGDFYTV